MATARERRDLEQQVRAQIAELRRHGLQASLPFSGRVHAKAARLLSSDHHGEGLQLLWRQASICRGVARAADALWASANAAFSLRVNGTSYQPTPKTSEEKRLAGLMMLNRAVALHRKGGRSQPSAEAALEHLGRSRPLRPWRAVAWTLIALEESAPASTKAATEAGKLVNKRRQPELYVLIQKLRGDGDGRYQPADGGRERAAGVRAAECLYYFNE